MERDLAWDGCRDVREPGRSDRRPRSADGEIVTEARPPDELAPDCARCVGLCCVALPFGAGADFPFDKPAGQPCPNLAEDHRCTIHDRLRPSGFPACVAYDCVGAGQHVTQISFGGTDWRRDPAVAEPMFAAFRALRPVHELRAHVREARGWAEAGEVHAALDAVAADLASLGAMAPSDLAALDVGAWRGEVAPLLRRASALVRAAVRADADAEDLAGVDLVGADLSGRDLRAADLRGALLVAADLRGADLRWACLLGADLRGARLGGADLSDALLLTRSQLESAVGDGSTRVPVHLVAPAHW